MAISKELKYHLHSVEGSLKDKKEIKLPINRTKGIYIIHRALVQQMHEKEKVMLILKIVMKSAVGVKNLGSKKVQEERELDQ